MAILMALTVFAGFAPTFYLRSYFGAPVTFSGAKVLTPLTQLHGAVFTAWVLLFVVQTFLVAGRRVALHRRLGIAGVLLAAAMVVAGVMTSVAGAEKGSAPPGENPIEFLVIPLVDMLLFAGFVIAAVRMRRNREAHKRLMILAYTAIISAAMARIPGIGTLVPPAFIAVSLLPVVFGAVYDFASRRRVHAVYLWGGALIALSMPLRIAVSKTAAWHTFAEFLVR